MKKLTLCAAVCFFITAAFAQELNWAELARRPDLWPAQCAAKQEMKFDGGVVVRPGQKLAVLKVMPTEAQVETIDTHTAFTVEPDEVDLLGAAQAAFAKLTPKQRALSYEAVVRQKDLWPQRVAVKKAFDFGGGRGVREGEQVVVEELLPDRLSVIAEGAKTRFQVAPMATDIMALARMLVEDQKAAPRFVDAKQQEQEKQIVVEQKKQTLGPVFTELGPELISSVTGKPAPFDESALPKYIVLFRGSSTCPITRQFAPTLIRYYQQMKPRHPEFEIVYLMTETPENTSKFARELGFSWRAIKYNHGYMPTVMQPVGSLLPQLIVMDRNGRVLANGIQNAAPNALKQLDMLLRTPAARP